MSRPDLERRNQIAAGNPRSPCGELLALAGCPLDGSYRGYRIGSEPSNNPTAPAILSGVPSTTTTSSPRSWVSAPGLVKISSPRRMARTETPYLFLSSTCANDLPVHRGSFKNPQGADLHIRKVEAQIRKGKGIPGTGTQHLIPVRSNFGDELLDFISGYQVFSQDPRKDLDRGFEFLRDYLVGPEFVKGLYLLNKRVRAINCTFEFNLRTLSVILRVAAASDMATTTTLASVIPA